MSGILNVVPALDPWKKYSVPLLGLLATEVGTLWTLRLTWSFLGRYAMCGGGFCSTLWLSQFLLHKGYTKIGYEVGIASSLITMALATKLNFSQVQKGFILGGAFTVFIADLNGILELNRKEKRFLAQQYALAQQHALSPQL
eukprot:TRINITY_DN27057_c0_g1_i1.p1 TRINITY_DN27057_c0_g1~~TRINITY_DN27057_c0_g1_i1.p1  ORF type:complete len:142 (-),score=26.12 TRINITY_DN27057_c0_g1_i1:62-487(-)